jgi:CheY-like chemotaxis protein
LLAFASKRVVQPHNVDVGALIRNQDRFLRRVIGEQINLRSHVDDNLWPVLADPTQLEQVILNLAVNARDAMPDGGHITLEVHNIVLEEAYTDGHADVEAGPWVVVAVSDTGVGIPPDILEHIFEPFFTTKKAGSGTGLGLATVYGVVRQCNGRISVYSEPGIGTTFKVYLPRSPSDTPWVETSPRAEARDGTERVLIVEDEADVRRMVLRALESAGYLVHAEATPSAALAWIRAQHGAVDLVITDVVMPEMNGKQLATTVHSEFPNVRILYISGYTENTIVHRGVLQAGVEFLAKPFSPADVRRRVRAVLDRPPEHFASPSDPPS